MEKYIFTKDYNDIILNCKPYHPKKGEVFKERKSDGWFTFQREDTYWSVAPSIIEYLISKEVLELIL